MTRIRTEQDSYYLLFNELLHARVLYEKSMYKECFHVLKKVKEKAIYYENYFALLVAQRLELNYLLTLDYENMDNLSLEARQKLTAIKPLTLGQASRISGINPSDIAILAMRVK